jgi:hypothetical protein
VTDDIADAFEWYADWASDISPLYERLARGVVDEPALLEMAQDTQEGQPPPNLLLGAVHALLLDGVDHPLREYYPTCVEEPLEPDDGVFERFRAFCLAHEQPIRDIVSTRRVQTNEVGRSAVLYPSFAHVAQQTRTDSLALVEVGASAGLNLYWDRFHYVYDDEEYGDPDSPVEIRSEIHGETQPPLPELPPRVTERIGVDLNPLSVTDDADAHWLQALVIPDQQERHERLAATIDVVREDPPKLVAGDVLDVLPDVLADVPDEPACCVFSTLTLYQFEDEDIATLREHLREASHERPIHWLSGDPNSTTDTPEYRHVVFADGAAVETKLATYKAYGEWIRWHGE